VTGQETSRPGRIADVEAGLDGAYRAIRVLRADLQAALARIAALEEADAGATVQFAAVPPPPLRPRPYVPSGDVTW
jgi:hypothetical protein